MPRKAYVNSVPDMRNAQMNYALFKVLDPQLAKIALKKISNHKSTALEQQLPFAQLVEKIHQEDNTRTHTDRHKIKTNCTLSESINNISKEMDNLAVDIRAIDEHMAYGF